MTWDERASVYAGAACAWRGSTSAYRRAARQRPLVGDAHAAGFSGGGPHARAQLAAGLALAVEQQTGLEFILRHRMRNERRAALLESQACRSCEAVCVHQQSQQM